MGLDIYFYKTKTSVAPSFRNNENIETFSNERVESRKKNIPTSVMDEIKALVADASTDARSRIKELLTPYCQYEWVLEDILCEDNLQKIVDYAIDCYASGNDMYYRKVNFLYAFFAEALTDEQCVVTKHDVETIISHCKEVLADHSLAEKLLPTQAGFFFGSTDYNEWYFKDVEYVLEQFTKYLEGWDDDTIGWVYFSW
jgi:hypothetical protein